MRAFVEIRRLALNQSDLKEHLAEIKQRLGEHDMQLNSIYDAIENFLDERQHSGNGMKEKESGSKSKKISVNSRMII